MRNILGNSNFGFTKWCVALIAAGWIGAAQAQVTISSSSAVTENFNSLGTSATANLPSGWKMSAAGAGTTAGYSTAANVTAVTQGANSGSPTAGGRYNWGDGTPSTDRAIGFMTSGSYANPNGIMVQYQNNTGSTITALAVSFDIERYRINSAAASVTFFTSTDGTTWSAATAGDSGAFVTGTSAYTYSGGTVVSKSFNLTGLSIANGSSIYFKWNFNTTGTNSQGLGLDNVSVTAATSVGGTPPTITGISPSSGLAGTIVTITGTDFTGATAVSFNGGAAASFTVNSATSITATAPTGVTTGPISVTTAGGTASSTGNFTVPALSIAVSGGNSINEGDSSRTATITATPAPTSDLTVTLTSSSATDLTVDGGNGAGVTATATISANTTEASFFLNVPADNTVDADASVTLTARASGYNSGTAAVTVRNVDFNPPAIVINKIFNAATSGSGAGDVVELLVVGNGTPGSTVNLQGMILKDYSSSAASDGGGAYIFSSNALWSAVKAGTLIVLTYPGTTPPAEDLDGSDFVIKINLTNTNYFTAGTGTFDIGGTELVQIKASGSGQAGSTGAIHSFAIGTSSAAQVAAAPAPKLICAVSGNNPFVKNSTKALADFNGTDAAQNPTALTLGLANNADNAAYIASLRGSKDISISVASDVSVINEDAGLQAGKITVALSAVVNSDLTVTLAATPVGVVTIPSTVVIPSGSSSATIDVTPINDTLIAGNRTVTITGSATDWNSGSNSMTVVDVQFNNPTVVINEIVNSGADSIELLVIQNNLNMVGMIVKDFSTNMTGDAGAQYTFKDVALWQSVKSGTLIVLTNDATATEDTDASDGLVTLKLNNTTYFTAAGSFDIANTDMVMIKAAGSGTSGISGAIHTFGNGAAGSLFRQANGAKLLYATGGGGAGADNANSVIGDYNGTGATTGNTLGLANNANNQTYITALRSSSPVPPTITSTNAFSGTVGVAFSNTITATGSTPIAFSGTDLPGGLSVATNGVISGTPTAAGPFNATLTASNSVGSTNQAATFTIAKGTPVITVAPTASAIKDGQALSASVLSGGTASGVAGSFTWTTPSTVPAVGTATYGVTFTPTDTANYNTATTTVSLTVNPAGTTYSGWLSGASASDAAFLDYVFGAATPGTLDPSLRPAVAVTDGNLVLTYYVRQGTVGLTVTPKTSADLAAGPSGWTTADVTVDNVGAAREVNGVIVQQKTASVPVSGAKKFLRVEAVQQ